MILCLTPNPAIDRTLYVNTLNQGEVHRAEKVLMAAGGKGINVARAIRTLGGDPLCMGPIGGHAGNLLADLAKQEGLSAQWTRVRNETRTCVILVHEEQDATLINESGSDMKANECEALIEDVLRQVSRADLICTCGSLPPGFSQEQFRSMLTRLAAMDKQVWVDTSGDALKTALAAKGICIKVNSAELGEAMDMEISNTEQAVIAMQRLRENGVPQIAVTLGREGAILSLEAGTWAAKPPQIEILSSVGSGDAFLGGLLFGLERGASPQLALRKAVGAGTANALEFGGGRFSRAKLEALYENVKVSALSQKR